MAFCRNCGNALPDGAKFCTNCGESTGEDKSRRREEYAGTVTKCPSCGEILGALTPICPACGFEIKGAEIAKAVKDFTKALDALDKEIASGKTAKTGWKTWSTGKRSAWLLLNIPTLGIPETIRRLTPRMKVFFSPSGTPTLSAAEKKKAALIENFTFPADRASILEALLFMKSKIAFLASEKPTEKSVYWLRLWTTKAEELSEKAALLLESDKIAESARAEITEDKTHAEKTIKGRALAAVFFIVLHLLLAGTVYGFAVPKLISLIPEASIGEPYDFPKSKLALKLPPIAAESGETREFSETRLHLALFDISEKQFTRYMTDCEENGFSHITKKTENTFEATNSDGYSLRLIYYESIRELQIIVSAPQN